MTEAADSAGFANVAGRGDTESGATGHNASCALGGPPCSVCIAQISTPQDRVDAMREAIAEELEPLVTLTHLLLLCRDEHRALWESASDPRNAHRLASIDQMLAEVLPAPSVASTLELPVRSALVKAFDNLDVPPVVAARRLAELIDERYSHTFAESFRRRSPYQPGVGAPVPLDSPDLRNVLAMQTTSPPWRLANGLDETRHIRLAGEWAVQFRIIFDYGHFESLAGVITADTIVATCHPNRGLDELDFSHGNGTWRFPIGPLDPVRQNAEIDRLIAVATTAGAQIVVLPEPCVTERLATSLQEWVRRPGGPRLLVAGSYHHRDGRPGADSRLHRRRNTAIGWVRGSDRLVLHDKYSPADRPVIEGIQPDGWPEVRVHVTADGWHLAIVICRDLLNPQAVNALAEAGVNLLFVPTMSETLMAFGGPVAHLVGSGQALVAIANNPGAWTDEATSRVRHPARAMFGHPGLGQQTRLVNSPEPGPGVALMKVRSAAITWVPAASAATQSTADSIETTPTTLDSTAPSWLAAVAERTERPSRAGRRRRDTVPLRRAAVLVLLTEGPSGPCVLLTERATDLTHYPGQLVFPGGAVAAGDDGPIGTALREAVEEVGLDPVPVVVIGLLAPQALPDSGFLVDPVVAWSPQLPNLGSHNYAEVATSCQVPLRELALRRSAVPIGVAHMSATGTGPDLATLGHMTESIVDQLIAIVATVGDPHAGHMERSRRVAEAGRIKHQ